MIPFHNNSRDKRMKKGSKGGSKNQKSAGGGGSNGKDSSSAASVSPQSVISVAKELQLAELGPEVASFIAQTTEYQLREIIEDAIKVSLDACVWLEEVSVSLDN